MSALVINGSGGKPAITYVGSIKLQTQAVGRVSVSRFGLAEGDVTWRCPTSLALKLCPNLGIQHPLIKYLYMETIELDFDNAYTNIIGHFVGAFPGATPTYEYQPSFGEDPIQSHPDFSSILSAAGAAGTAYKVDGNGLWLQFNQGAGDHLAGLTSYLVSQGFYVESSVLGFPPDCSNDGHLASPDGSPPSSDGNWIQAPTFFEQRANVYNVRRSWKNSGRLPFPNSVYS